MTAVLAVAQRELVARSTWLVAALVAGLLPLGAPLLPWVDAASAADARSLLAAVMAGTLMAAAAVAMGLSMVGSDLAERRLGFYFSRPLTAGAIWWGKVAASFLIVVLVGVLAALPASLVGRSLVVSRLGDPTVSTARLAAGAVLAVLLVLGIAHALGVMGRSRSVWLAFDLAAAGVVGGVIWALQRRLLLAGAWQLQETLLASSLVALVIGLLVAGWVQVAVGRTELQRGHRALSLTLWGALGSFSLVAAGYAAWLFSATPSSLAQIGEILAPRTGPWTVVVGTSPGRGDYYPRFLLDTSSGRWLRLGGGARPWHVPPCFSADGRRVVWLQPTGVGPDDPSQVVWCDLSEPQPRPLATPLLFGQHVRRVQVSPSGQRLAVNDDTTLSVYSLPDGALLASTRLEATGSQVAAYFVTDDELAASVWPEAPSSWRSPADAPLWRLDVRSGRLERTGTLQGSRFVDTFFNPVDPLGEVRLAVHPRGDEQELVIHDARTGAPRATLLARASGAELRATFLADGRIVASEHGTAAGAPARVHLFDRQGHLLRSVSLPSQHLGRFGGEVTRGVLIVTLARSDDWFNRDLRPVLVDLESGTVRRLPPGYIPAETTAWSIHPRVAEAGSAAARLFFTPTGGFALYEASSGRFTPVPGTRRQEP